MTDRRRERRNAARRTANLLNGSTLLGLGVARLGRCRIADGPDRLILADHYRFSFPIAGAFTVGDVVLTRHDWPSWAQRFPQVLAHEEKHARQWALSGGLPFLPLYLLAMGWSWLRTGDRASRNLFERRAGLLAGGYTEYPVRSLRARAHIQGLR
ncbi:hypothetical protein ACMYYO_09340 [Dermacoccaceae bacterium W4C1]